MTKRTILVEESDVGAADIAIEAAHEQGDFKPLLARLRSGDMLTREEREAAAEIIEGTLKRPKHRPGPTEPQRDFMTFYIALSVRIKADRGMTQKAAVSEVAAEMALDASQVYAAVRKRPDLKHCSWK